MNIRLKSMLIIVGLCFHPYLARAVDISTLFSGFLSNDSADYSLRYAPAKNGGNPDGTPSIVENRLRGNMVLTKNASKTVSLNGRVSHLNMNFSPTIAQTGQQVPNSLWDIEGGGVFRKEISDRKEWGMNASIGSASNTPFNSFLVSTLRLGAYYHIPSGKTNSWLFSLNYSNNRYFANNIPLPGISYLFQSPKGTMDALVGFPVISFRYRPTPLWSSRFSMFGPTNISAEVARSIAGPLRAYGGFDWSQPSWLNSNRPEKQNRLFYDSKRWTIGLKSPLSKKVSVDVFMGYEFNRSFFEADSALEKNPASVNFESTGIVGAKILARF